MGRTFKTVNFLGTTSVPKVSQLLGWNAHGQSAGFYKHHAGTWVPAPWRNDRYLESNQSDTAGFFGPTPIPVVATEDPALSAGPATTGAQLLNSDTTNPDFKTKVVMRSYPIIRNGLIYVIEVRNGLFILRYTGPHANEVQQISLLEGNSNLDML